MATEKRFNLEQFFSALADRTRLRLLNLMKDGEVCVCFFAETLGTNNPKISRHLAYLKRAGLVAARRDGKWSHYRIVQPNDKATRELFGRLLKLIEDDDEMRLDRRRFTNVCCAPKFVEIAGASRRKKDGTSE